MKVKDVLYYKSDKIAHRSVMCPACNAEHEFDDRWVFNGDYDKPTFRPSMNWVVRNDEGKNLIAKCHSWVTDGKIQFLSDCSHEMKNQTVELTNFTKQ